MHEYIRRSDAIEEINRGDLLVGNCADWAKEIIWRTPYADVTEIRHGTWESITKQHGNESDGLWTEKFIKCSICGYERRDAWIPKHKPNYCEECGAKMDGDGNG